MSRLACSPHIQAVLTVLATAALTVAGALALGLMRWPV